MPSFFARIRRAWAAFRAEPSDADDIVFEPLDKLPVGTFAYVNGVRLRWDGVLWQLEAPHA